MNRELTPKTRWTGFQPVGYSLAHKAFELPLLRKSADGTQDLPTTVGDVYGELADKRLTAESLYGWHILETKLETTDGIKVLVKGRSFNQDILKMMLKFRDEDVNPFEVVFFYFGKDYCVDD